MSFNYNMNELKYWEAEEARQISFVAERQMFSKN